GSASGHGEGHDDSSGGGQADFAEADADTVVDVTLKDFAFEGIPAKVKGPRVFFRSTNQGSAEHELMIMKGDEMVFEMEPIAAGEEGTLAAELEPGEYRIMCLVEAGEKTHEDLGMAIDLVVE
ncbi:MAG: hypothetical protein ACLGHT_02005, partial [Acidimicrobiia bacterium]